ncbi:MAG TPA: hypothetical protein VLL07_05730 [Pontiella sp.]|nr:hypothetical protein [Pontiella sp.]
MRNSGNLFLAVLIIVASLSGCTHQLEIKNLNKYYSTSLAALDEPVRSGVISNSQNIDSAKIVKLITEGLRKYNATATSAIRPDKSNVDIIATFSVNSEYKGSGWNFLINFPGFLIWTPAWNGYVYKISHDVNILLTDAKTGKQMNSIRLPIELNIRHADFNRTWTEISWLEFGIIAFVGGIFFIQYDDNVTPLAAEKAGPVLGDYVAQEIISKLHFQD